MSCKAISKGAWQNGRKACPGTLVAGAQGLREGCARVYWLARTVVGYNKPSWTTAVIIKRINWITKHYGTGDEGFRRFFKWLLGTHRIGQYEHMKPEYRHRLPEIEANYQAWMAKLGGSLYLPRPRNVPSRAHHSVGIRVEGDNIDWSQSWDRRVVGGG